MSSTAAQARGRLRPRRHPRRELNHRQKPRPRPPHPRPHTLPSRCRLRVPQCCLGRKNPCLSLVGPPRPGLKERPHWGVPDCGKLHGAGAEARAAPAAPGDGAGVFVPAGGVEHCWALGGAGCSGGGAAVVVVAGGGSAMVAWVVGCRLGCLLHRGVDYVCEIPCHTPSRDAAVTT